MQLPPVQQSVWNVIVRRARRDGQPPAPHEIGAELGLSHSGVAQHLRLIEKKGLLELRSAGPGRRPHMALTPAGRALAGLAGVPVLGTIPAGPLADAVQHASGHLRLPTKPGLFGLRVQGDSMAEALQDGDVVLLQAQAEPRQGEVCAVRVNGDRATLKKLHWFASTARLVPNNPAFETVEVPLEAVHVDGVVRSLVRGDLVADLLDEDPAV